MKCGYPSQISRYIKWVISYSWIFTPQCEGSIYACSFGESQNNWLSEDNRKVRVLNNSVYIEDTGPSNLWGQKADRWVSGGQGLGLGGSGPGGAKHRGEQRTFLE